MAQPHTVLEYPASAAQQRMWFVEQLAPGEPVHHINVELDTDTLLDAGALRAALGDLVDRHESLRTVFRTDEGGGLVQVVRSGLDGPPLREVDLGPDEDAWRRHRTESAAEPFDLGAGPLLRVDLVRRGPDRVSLLVVVHHLVADGWSFEVLLRELAEAYAARAAGREPGWEPLPVQYADFTAWQRQRLTEPEAVADLAYWRDRLADLPTVDLTRGRPRPAEFRHTGGTVPVDLSAPAAAALRNLAVAGNGTLFMALATLWAEAVGRFFGVTDLALGTPTGGRPLTEVAGVVGMFVDRVVLRLDTSGRPSFRTLFGRVRDTVIEANEHTTVTFEQVVDALRPPRELGVTPLFQVSINLVPLVTHDGGQFGNGTVRHDLNLEMTPARDGAIAACVEYRDGVVTPADAEGVASLFARLVAAAVADPDAPLRDVPTLDGGYAHLLRDGGDPVGLAAGVPEVPADGIAALILARAAETPRVPAVVTPDRTLTYAELAAHIRAFAARLTVLGVRPETPLLLLTRRRAELVVAMFGTLAAGGAYVPVDPDAPARHIQTVAATVGARLALVSPGDPVPLPAGMAAVTVALDDPAAPPDPDAPSGPLPRVGPDCAAYVMFTSGTTGVPKGIVVEHRQMLGYARAGLSVVDPPAGASWLLVQPPTFDSGLTQVFGALLTGGTLHLLDGDVGGDPAALSAYCAAHPIDYLKITPTHLSALLAGGATGHLRPRRALVLGGESSTREFVTGLMAGGWRVIGHYGPTETTVGVLAHPLAPDTGGTCPVTPLGPPMTRVRAYVLDAEAEPVPPGCAGELYIGGPQVARGYMYRPGRTAGVFLPDPYATAPGSRMYRTGDVVRLLPDGAYEFLGRADRQVKINGVRIEPGAVEALLGRHPGVAQAVCTVRGGRLVAYVVATDPAAPPDPADLHTTVAAQLPAASVPSAYLVVPAIPRRASGKMDVDALPDPVRTQPAILVPPGTPTEAALAAAVATVLGFDAVSVTDRFFDLGGDSIKAIYLVAQARAAGVTVTVRDVFTHQTVRDLAAAADGQGAAARGSALAWWRDHLRATAPVVPRLAGPSVRTSAGLPADARAVGSGAHVAYRTTDLELLLAAVAGELAARGVAPLAATVDIDGRPVPVVVDPARADEPAAGSDTGTDMPANPPRADRPVAAGATGGDLPALVRAARDAVRLSTAHADGWALLGGSAPAAPDVLVHSGALAGGVGLGPAPDGARRLVVACDGGTVDVCGPLPADAVAARLAAIVRHCAQAGPSYSAADFPDSGLDTEQLARLLANLAVDGSGR